MSATGFGVAFVVLASIGLVVTLVGILLWLLVVIFRGFSRSRRVPPTTRR